MALNKFMHPRNIYKTPPDFEKLSKLYPEFSKINKMDVTGKVMIDFKDPHSLRVLTKCLLKSDFNLDVEIPEDRLVPTLPLRLNYILWIEDLMSAIQRDSNICGIDIGTGACAIYPLLAAVKNKWHMLATEVDDISLQKAQFNIHRNNLQGLIELRNNKGSKLIENLFTPENEQKYDFCMCNPPFYSNLQELYESRSPARLPPKNGFTGSPQELITEGGELKFCRKLIEESKICKDNVLIFTTMIGHKYNLAELVQDLKAEGIKHTHTEFCQGRVTRWGLAWTYQNHDIYQLVPPRDKQRKKNLPITHQLPQIPNGDYNVETAYEKIKALFNGLNIEQKILNKYKNRISLDILAKENTWSNQRRKRRLMKRMETPDSKKLKIGDHVSSNYESNPVENGTNKVKCEVTNCEKTEKQAIESSIMLKSDEDRITNHETNEEKTIKSSKLLKTDEDGITNGEASETQSAERNISSPNMSIEATDSQKSNSRNHAAIVELPQETRSAQEPEPLLHAFMKLYKKEETIQLEVVQLDGTGGKESVHQVVQYIKNNWK